MSKVDTDFRSGLAGGQSSRWHELWLKEDWWAIWLGLGIVLAGYVLFAEGSSLKWIAVTPPKWTSFAQLGAHFADNYARYAAPFLMWLAVFGVALSSLGYKPREFVPASFFIMCGASPVIAAGQ